MPPRKFSRYSFTSGVRDADDALQRFHLTDRVRFLYLPLSDNIQHIANQGDTLWNLASRFYAPIPRPAGLWWVVADFQPDPIHDPTVRLDIGRLLMIPSLRTVTEQIFSASRVDLSA